MVHGARSVVIDGHQLFTVHAAVIAVQRTAYAIQRFAQMT
jgi:hypothetical protein